MGRSNTGKQQETAQLNRNNTQQDQDRASRDKYAGQDLSAIQNLQATPGYTPGEMQAMEGEQADMLHSIYGSAGDTLTRHAAITGNRNDVGLTPAMERMARERAMQVASGKVGIQGKNAEASYNTRANLPAMYGGLSGLYNGSAGGYTGANSSMVNQRMQIDNTPTFLQQMTLQAMQSAGQAATGAIHG